MSKILCVKSKSRVEVRYKVKIFSQFHAATTCDSDDVVYISLVQLMYKALVLACCLLLDVSNKLKLKHGTLLVISFFYEHYLT